MHGNFRYQVTIISSKDGSVLARMTSKTVQGVKEQVRKKLGHFYQWGGNEIVYVRDADIPEEHLEAIADIIHNQMSREDFMDYGFDFDVWHDCWLSKAERNAYDETTRTYVAPIITDEDTGGEAHAERLMERSKRYQGRSF